MKKATPETFNLAQDTCKGKRLDAVGGAVVSNVQAPRCIQVAVMGLLGCSVFCLTGANYFYSPSDIDLLDSHLQAGRQAAELSGVAAVWGNESAH